MENVLFLCTGNSARSQMAEGYLRHFASDRFRVFSAGTEPKGVNPYTVRAMNEVGIDISRHTSNHVDVMTGRQYRYLITVCAHADENCPAGIQAQADEKLHWNFDDPAAVTGTDDEIMAAFREIREQISAKIQDWLIEIG